MKKLINHVHHVAYLSSWENLGANIAHLEAITGAKLRRTLRPQHGAMICVDWSAGLEVAMPLPGRGGGRPAPARPVEGPWRGRGRSDLWRRGS